MQFMWNYIFDILLMKINQIANLLFTVIFYVCLHMPKAVRKATQETVHSG